MLKFEMLVFCKSCYHSIEIAGVPTESGDSGSGASLRQGKCGIVLVDYGSRTFMMVVW